MLVDVHGPNPWFVTSMLKELKCQTLQQRRTNTKMVMMYRVVHHLIAISSQMYITPATTRTKRGHDQKFKIPFSRIQSHQNSYFPSAIRTWNNLPAVLISFPTPEAFKVESLVYNSFIWSMIQRIRHKFYQLMESSSIYIQLLLHYVENAHENK